MSANTSAARTFAGLCAAEYPDLPAGHLNAATHALAPARTLSALRRALDSWAAGQPDTTGYEAAVADARAAFARITGVPVARVALASTVAGSVGLVAAQLPPGAEVVAFHGDFSSLVHPFAARPDLRLRLVPLEDVADAVRAGTALVAVSAAQSADGRVADLAAIRAAADAHGARVLVDATQAIGWLPLDAGLYDYVVCHGYKWLVSPHGACFLTVRADAEATLSPAFTGWYGGDDPSDSCYGPIADLAPDARRFDARPAYLAYVGAAASLSLIEEIGVEAIHAYDAALAERLRAGFAALGYAPVPGPSAIVAIPDVPAAVHRRLTEAGVAFSARAGNLRFATHFYNTGADIDLALSAAAG